MDNPLIITCSVIGAELTKKDYPYLPANTDELAKSATDAVKSGASIIHLHVRDSKGQPTQSIDTFDEVTRKIRESCDCIIQYSTGGAVNTSLEERCAPLSLKPDMATLSMGTLNFGSEIFENSNNTIKTIAKSIQEFKIMPELEIFDLGMMEMVEQYLKMEFIPKKFHIDFVLGVPGGISGNIKNLLILTDLLKSNQTWSVAGIGKCQLPLTTHAIAMGGHVRVGIEDNIYLQKGELAKSNAEFVERTKRIATELNRPVATVEQTRNILDIN